MVLTRYYMMCLENGKIMDARLANTFQADNLSIVNVLDATFSTDSGDSPDVLVIAPLPGGTFVEPDTYSPPSLPLSDPYLKADDWSLSESGSIDPDDGVWEMASPDGIKSVTLKVKKWDRTSNTAITGEGDTFGIMITGHCDCPEGRLSLDANGEATLTLIPDISAKGELQIILNPINISYRSVSSRVRFV